MEYHLLTCMKSGLKAEAHSILKRSLHYLMVEAGMSAENEPIVGGGGATPGAPSGTIRCDIGSHDGGKYLVIDTAMTHPLSADHRSNAIAPGGRAADHYARRKMAKVRVPQRSEI
jgi:hypothetical protein